MNRSAFIVVLAFITRIAVAGISFSIEGPGEIVATDHGDRTSFESFRSPERKAFSGMCLVIVRGKAGQGGRIKVWAKSDGLTPGVTEIRTGPPLTSSGR